jgi:hypothetical protein
MAVMNVDDDTSPAPLSPHAVRQAGRRLAVVALAAVAVAGSAVAAVRHESAPTPNDTVRGFLVTAVVDQDTVTACKYLTSHAKAEIAAAEPRATPCEQGLMGARLTLGGDALGSEAAVKLLRYHARQDGGRARVTVQANGATRAFTLRRVTGQSFAGPGPDGSWRIDGGVGALVAPGGVQ